MLGKSKYRLTVVIDTNILVDYPNILPGFSDEQPEEPTIDLSGALLVIPSVVVRELSSFKNEKSERGRAARQVLRHLRHVLEHAPLDTLYANYHLSSPIYFRESNQYLAVLPIHRRFRSFLPFTPADNDMDGQIIVTALAVNNLLAGMPIDYGHGERYHEAPNAVTLLTNDNGLAIRAFERGIATSRYGYKYPEPYTGRRDVIVSPALFYEFYNTRRLDRTWFEEMLPDERPLVANEFVIMALEDESTYPNDFCPTDGCFSYIGRYDIDEDAIVPLRYVRSFPVKPKNAGQAIFAEALMNPRFAAVICQGPAGSGKTFMSAVYGYEACKKGEYIGVTVVPCESQSRIGALPGDLDEKMDPDVQPIKNALRNYILSSDSKLEKELAILKKFGTEAKCGKSNGTDNSYTDRRSVKVKLDDHTNLIWSNWFTSIPVESARGRDFRLEYVIYDEFQDQNKFQADTLIKRLGDEGKIIITGDIEQIHAPYLDHINNGLVYAARLLYNNPMVAQVCFTEDEVVRHPLVREVARRQKRSVAT